MSGWEKAIKKPWSGHPGGAFTKKPLSTYTPPAPEPEYSPDDFDLATRYHVALKALAEEDRRFKHNFEVFRRWSVDQQLKWIVAIEQQAIDELDTIGVHVVTRVVMNRLE